MAQDMYVRAVVEPVGRSIGPDEAMRILHWCPKAVACVTHAMHAPAAESDAERCTTAGTGTGTGERVRDAAARARSGRRAEGHWVRR